MLNVLYCRVCLSSENNKVIMDTTNGWLDLFSYCFDLQIHPREEARALCGQCADSIKSFAKVKVKCLESDIVWKTRFKASQFKMEVKNDNMAMKTDNEEYLTESEVLKDNTVLESKKDNNALILKSDSDGKNCTVEQLEELDDDDDHIHQNAFQFINDDKQIEKYDTHDTFLESDTSKVSDAEVKKPYRSNDNVTMETDDENYLNESELKENTFLELKKENDILVILVDSKKTNNSEEQIEELDNNGVRNEFYCKNYERVGNSENDVTFREPDAKDIFDTKIEMCCGCGIPYIDNRIRYSKHKKHCHVRKFYALTENQNDSMKSCGLCDFSTQDAKILCQHFCEHYRRNDVECKLCDYTGQDFANMAYHRYEHMPTDKSKLYCLKCLRLFHTSKALQFHFRTKHMEKEKGGLCFCGNVFSSIKSWSRHERTKHSDVEDSHVFICDCCRFRFPDRGSIVSHLRARAGLNKVACKECGASFSRKNIKLHMINMHSKKQRVKCPKCPKTLAPSSIDKHIKWMHGDKNFFCDLCSAAYTTLVALQYHMLGHTKQRPLQCRLCNASYKSNSLLTIHMRKHTGERPFVCNICCKGFASSKQLKVHNSAHTKLRKYQCKECNRSFHKKKLLLDHCAKTHPKFEIPG